MPSASFFVQDGYGPSAITTFDELVDERIKAAGAIGPKSVTVINPSGADDVVMFYVNAEVEVQQITVSVRGTNPSITVDLGYSTTPDGTLTSIVTGGIAVTDASIVTAFDNGTIPADSYVRLVTSSLSGVVDELACSLDF